LVECSLVSDDPTIEILGVPIARLSIEAALERLVRLHDEAGPSLVAYANAHTLNIASRDPGYREVLRSAAIVLNDGSGVGIAARLWGRPFPANLNGTDLNLRILRVAAERGWPVFLLGARPGVADAAARKVTEAVPGLEIAGTHDGYFSPEDESRLVEAIRTSGAELLMVAMGNPLQERWLARHLSATGARLGIGVGAFFDFTAGTVKRAPAWMNRLGVEWVWRLGQEPRRMWRRYVLGNPVFLVRVLRERFSSRGRSPAPPSTPSE
jgi:exopolysaccharide biosynthesis WecB/TagA/CpsF family protein